MKKISISEAIDALSKKYFGCNTIEFFERARDKRLSKPIDPLSFGFCITDIISLVYEYENATKAEISKLKIEVEGLRKLLNKNPTNSHKPPSSERNNKIKNSREKTGKSPGAQPGHVGAAHELHDSPDAVHRHDIEKCTECRGSLKGAEVHEIIRKQTIDIVDGKMYVTEHQTIIKFCPNCDRWNRGNEPKELQKSRIVFGPNVKSIALYLMVQQLLPFCRTQEILFDLFGVPISQGSLCNFITACGVNLSDWESDIKLQLLASPLNHVDETGLRCEKRNDWAHVISNKWLTLIIPHKKRGKEAINDIGILPEYKGHLVHDGFFSYWGYGGSHSLCNGHILRELKYLHEEENQKWSLQMSTALKLALHELHGGQKATRSWRAQMQKKFTKILQAGFTENNFADDWQSRKPDSFKNSWENGKPIKIPVFWQRKHSKAMNLLNRLRDYRTEVLAFALKQNIPFTNNQAERDFRMVKLKEKISGCFRSEKMAKMFLRVRSYLSTMRKQQLPLLENLVFVEICC